MVYRWDKYAEAQIIILGSRIYCIKLSGKSFGKKVCRNWLKLNKLSLLRNFLFPSSVILKKGNSNAGFPTFGSSCNPPQRTRGRNEWRNPLRTSACEAIKKRQISFHLLEGNERLTDDYENWSTDNDREFPWQLFSILPPFCFTSVFHYISWWGVGRHFPTKMQL